MDAPARRSRPRPRPALVAGITMADEETPSRPLAATGALTLVTHRNPIEQYAVHAFARDLAAGHHPRPHPGGGSGDCRDPLAVELSATEEIGLMPRSRVATGPRAPRPPGLGRGDEPPTPPRAARSRAEGV